jgi:uroporphyrinogen-III synthase
MSALCGRTVVVTRPRIDGERLATRLAERGARAVLFPTIDVRPVEDPRALDEELHRLPTFDWIVFTSAHAVAHTWTRAHALGIVFPPATRIAAIGPATREALNERGLSTCVVPPVYRGAALPDVLPDVRGHRMLLPLSDIGRDEAADGLRRAGATVVSVTAYRTLPAAPDEEGLARLRLGVDAVLFTSPSTVQNFERLLRSEAIAVLSRAAVVCIGPTTADAARTIGVDTLVAPVHTTDGMLALLEENFARRAVLATTGEGA